MSGSDSSSRFMREGNGGYIPAVLFLLSFLLAIFPVHSFDVYWHLANGREMVEGGSIVNTELFSYTKEGTSFANHEWLSQILFYVVFDALGINGLLFLKALTASLLVLLLYLAARTFHVSGLAAAAIALAAYLAIINRVMVRPHLFSFLLLALVAWLLYGYRAGKVGGRTLLAVPLLFTLWGYLHVPLYGMFFIGAFAVGESVKRALAGVGVRFGLSPLMDWRRVGFLWLVLALTLFLLVLSPHTLSSYRTFLQYLSDESLMQGAIREFQPPAGVILSIHWTLVGLLALLALAHVRHTDLTQVIVLVPVIVVASSYGRAVAIFVIMAVPAFSYYVGLAGKRLLPGPASRRLWKAGVAGALVLLVGYSVFLKATSPVFGLGTGLREDRYPAGATRFIRETNLRGNMYNDGKWGGYLAFHLYPERRIFLYNHSIVFDDVHFETFNRGFVDKYEVDYAVFQDAWMQSLVFGAEEWVPVFWDGVATIVVRNTPRNRSFIERYGLRLFTPLPARKDLLAHERDPDSAADLVREVAQCLSFTKYDSAAEYFSLLITRGDLRMSLKERARLMDKVLRFNSDNPKLRRAKQALEGRR
jgi:hypothetical protein